MRWVYLAEVAGALVPSLILWVMFGWPGRHRDRSTAWMLASWGWSAVLLFAALLLSMLGIRLPAWAAALVLAGPLVVAWWWLIAYLRERRSRP